MIERLEIRRLFTSSLDGSGNLTVNGTAGNDTITVSNDGDDYVIHVTGDPVATFPITSVTGNFIVNGLPGNDRIDIDASVTKTLYLDGNEDDDTILGGAGNDAI